MKKILVVFGGRSAEHDISIITAHTPIMNTLKGLGGYDIYPLYIAKDGSWYCSPSLFDIEFYRQPNYESQLAKLPRVQLLFEGGLVLVWPGLRPKRVKLDVVFPAMHGTYGEDGSLMGLLRMANVPFVGCDMEASVIAMDKVLAKQVTQAAGVPSVPYLWLNKTEWPQAKAEIKKAVAAKIKYPVFVKPVHLGSSIAISKAKNPAELENAVEVALHYDDKVIIESSVEDLIEVTLPIMGNDELTFAHLEEPLAKFFDFDEKYLKQGKKGGGGVNSQYSRMPAKLPAKLSQEVKALGAKTYKAIGASGIARVDFLIDRKTQAAYMNEINTLPGSLYVHNWKQAGVSAAELVESLVKLAEDRFAQNQQTNYVFSSSVLSRSGSAKTSPNE